MSDDQDQPRRGGDAGTERALDELRVALEQLATRMGAGFREDLAQIRAIAASVAERDITADVEALRVDVASLVGRDTAGELRDDVAALRAEIARLASGDEVTAGLQSGIAPLQAAVDRIAARLDDDSGRTQVLARFEALEARLDQLAGADGGAEVLARLDALSARLDAMPTSQQVTNLPADLRAHLADALAGFDGDAVRRDLAEVRAQLGDGRGSLLEQLQDNLADVASGEVVGALWDEVRQLRTDLPDLVAAPEAVVPEPVVLEREPDPQLATLTDELSVLRNELAEGLVVEPSDALSASLDDLKVEIDALRTALAALDTTPQPVADREPDEQVLGQLADIRSAVDGVRARVDALPDTVPEPVVADQGHDDELLDQLSALRGAVDLVQSRVDLLPLTAPQPAAADTGPDEQVLDRLDTIRAAIDDVRSRLDEGAAAPDDGHRPSSSEVPDGAAVEALADQVAAMRDFVASELETLRQTLAARLDAAAEATAATVAAAAAPPEPAPAAVVPSTLDPEVVESLRDEIRSSGAIADQVIDALREELKALRRRIAVKAAERVLDEQQLAQIADAVAARLAGDRDD